MFKYHLRIQLSPSLDFEERFNNIIDFCDQAKIDDVMFFIGCEELNTGHITIDEAKKYVKLIKRASEELKKKGITVSLNPWMTLGHYDGAKTFKNNQKFKGLVGSDGTQAKLCVCPLSNRWREYYVELLNFYINELQPDTLWLEDDFRLFRHGAEKIITMACFCDEHMKIYNERLGRSYDREQLVSLISTDLEARKVFLDVCRETMEGTLKYITKNIKKQKRLGLMTGETNINEGRRFSELFSILGSDKREKPYNRLSLCVSRQISPQQTGQVFNRVTLLNRYLTGNTADCVTEIENNPHTLYTKSVRYNKFQQLSSIPALLVGTTLSIFEFNGNGVTNYERLAKMYAKIKPYLSSVEALNLSLTDMVGVHILLNQEMPYYAKVDSWEDLKYYDAGYFALWFELLGINCRYNTDLDIENEVVVLSGQTIRSLTEAQIRKLFAKNFIILNGDSVEALFDIGLNDIIDARGYVKCIERHSEHTFEEANFAQKIQGITRMRITNNWSSGNYLKIEYGDKEKEVYTKVLNYNESVFGNGFTRIDKALVVPHQEPNMVPFAVYHPLNEYVIKNAIKHNTLFDGKCFFIREENIAPYAFKKDGRIVLMCVNFCDDDYEQITIETGKKYANIKIITPSHIEEYTPSLKYEDGIYTIFETLKGEESFVLLFGD